MTKRRRFIVTSLVLTAGFFGFKFLYNRFRFLAIALLGLATLGLFYWSLREGLGKNMTLLSLILPLFFTLGVGVFWFLLPTSIFARLPILLFYGFGIYTLCLTMNIYTVSAIRTIALLRAARGVGFVLTLATSFLVLNTILSLKAHFLLTALLGGALAFPLFLQGFWAISLGVDYSKDLMVMSGVSSLILAEIAIALHFWPVTVVVGSLFLTVIVYVLLGLGQARLEARLFSQTIREYLFVGVLVFIGMLVATNWGG